MPRWEVRASLRYGSEHIGFLLGLRAAKAFVLEAIKKNGEGKIEMIDRNRRIIYYTLYADDA